MKNSFKQCLILLGLMIMLDLILLMNAGAFLLYAMIAMQSLASIYSVFRLRKIDYMLFFFIEAELSKKEPIVREIWEEACILAGWLLILLPGIFSCFAGLLLLNPDVRKWAVDNLFYQAV